MKLLQVFTLLQDKQITLDEAAEALGLQVKDLKFRLTRYGSRLPMVLHVLDQIADDQITRADAAVELQVSVRQINHLMENWKIDRPLKVYLIDREASKVKWEIRKKFAIDFIAGRQDIDKAADAAGVSTRQMRRWVSELLVKHFDMPWKDLVLVNDRRRVRMAEQIEEAEGLEEAKRRVADAVADGVKDLKEVALDRVVAKKSRRNPNVRRIE